MTFKELLKEKNITGYQLSKRSGVPYTTISDLINGKTYIGNMTIKNGIAIADVLNMDVEDLAVLDPEEFVEFIYFRNETLNELKRRGIETFIDEIIKTKEIDYYYKNGGYPYAYYLLALIDYLCRINKIPIYTKRYNNIRKERLDKAFFVGSELIHFDTIEEAEKAIGITVIPEFAKFNIIEEDVFNVA